MITKRMENEAHIVVMISSPNTYHL